MSLGATRRFSEDVLHASGPKASFHSGKVHCTADDPWARVIKEIRSSTAVREAVSGYIANEVNAKRDEVFDKIKTKFAEYVGKAIAKEDGTKLVLVHSINLSNLDFPDPLEKANVDRATQAVLKDKALAEQEKIKAEIETAKLEVTRAEVEAQAKARKIDIEGAALARNPEYYLRDIYYYASQNGSSVMVPNNPNVILQMTPRGTK